MSNLKSKMFNKNLHSLSDISEYKKHKHRGDNHCFLHILTQHLHIFIFLFVFPTFVSFLPILGVAWEWETHLKLCLALGKF